MSKEIIKQIYERHLSTPGDSFIEIFAGDDRKTGKQPQHRFLNLKNSSPEELISESEIYNIGAYGVFLNINPLCKNRRVKQNVKKILYVFIDLDAAEKEHNDLILMKLKEKGISYSYNAKSGNGYHILVPIDLDISYEEKIKGFLNYLREKYTNKVDPATADNGRLMRFPGSIHNKKDSIELKTLYEKFPSDEEIKLNSEKILEYQVEHKKGEKDLEYEKSIKREDIFFSTILNDKDNWKKYYDYLDKSEQRNNIFVKNLGIFLKYNPNYEKFAIFFLENWESSRVAALNGWKNKARELGFIINYRELLKWSKDYALETFQVLLEDQLKSCFLDTYEFYYLEDEKKENSHLMYYPERDYYVNKSLNEILMNVYYDCLESGIDLVKELDLDSIYEKWGEFSFKKQQQIILDNIYRKIITEKRLKTVFNINYKPSDEKFIYDNNKVFFNTYRKSELWDYYKDDRTYQFEYIKELIMNLCGNNEKNYNYFNKWLGWIIQNPTEKIPTAIILQGRQGSGKGTLKNLILDEIFSTNCIEINQTHLENSFNEYLMGKQIIVANEVMHNENKLTLPNVLKNLVTDEEITISRKFKKEVVTKNYTHWIFCTNSDNPLKIDEDDRRYSVFYSSKMRKGLGKDLRKNIEYERGEYISYLKSLEIDFEDVSEPVMTEAKEDIIEMNKDSVERFRQHLQKYNNLWEAYLEIFGNDKNYKVLDHFGDGEDYLLTEDFYLLYEKYCENVKEKGIFNKANFSKKISNKGVKTEVKRYKKKPHRVYNIAILEQWVKVE